MCREVFKESIQRYMVSIEKKVTVMYCNSGRVMLNGL